MSDWPNKPAAPNAGITLQLPIEHHWPGLGEPERSSHAPYGLQEMISKVITKVVAAIFLPTILLAAEVSKPPLFELYSVQDSAGAATESVVFENRNGIKEMLHIYPLPLMDATAFHSAVVSKNPVTGHSEILISLTEKGKKRFAELTRLHTGKRLACFINGKVVYAPRVLGEISGGKMIISGRFTEKEATKISASINAYVAGNGSVNDSAENEPDEPGSAPNDGSAKAVGRSDAAEGDRHR